MNDILATMAEKGMLDDRAVERVSALVAEGTPLDKALLDVSDLGEEEVLRQLSEEFRIPFVDLETRQPSREFLSQFPARTLLRYRLLPLEEKGGVVLVATSKPFDSSGLEELRLVSDKDLRPVLATSTEIDRCIRRCLGVGADTIQSLVADAAETGILIVTDEPDADVDLTRDAGDASIIRFVNQVLTEAIELRATDVHFEPFENLLRVRYRIDGVLQEANIPSEITRFHASIVSRLKIMSRLDIAEKRLPQDGRIKLKVANREIDVRASVIPMLHGEAVVLRLLDRVTALLGLEHLGMSSSDRRSIERILQLPHGIVLVTGPTGSGKTTTLYAALSKINDVQRKIITIEDPIEYHLRGINQIQVSGKAGLTFARGLRSILRHDPDVILVGEIRDSETTEIAVQASLTGHLVFSTLHTNDAPGAVGRLVDMGVEPYLVASSIEAVLAQRLVRIICAKCKQPCPPAEVRALQMEFGPQVPDQLYRGAGCRECQGTGYRGRVGIFEFMPITDEIRALRVSAQEVRKVAMQQGMKSLREDGWRHVRQGRTTIEDVVRMTKDERLNGNGPLVAGRDIREDEE